MIKTLLTISTIAVIAILLSSCGVDGGSSSNETSSPAINESSFSSEVKIGTQVWMTKNLDVAKFRNGDVIPEAKSAGEWKAYANAGEAAWCYYDNDPKNGEKYGKLYNWYAVNDPRGLAPKGWHIPSDDEWTVLTDYLRGEEKAGAKMKSKTGWAEDGNGTNSSGFSGLPGGYRSAIGTFDNVGKSGSWWSSTEINANYAWLRYLYYYGGDDYRYSNFKARGVCVRCLRD